MFWDKKLAGISVISSICHDRICGIRIQLANDLALSILSVYLPAVGGDDSFPNCLDELSSIVEALGDDSLVMICGDFNADVGTRGGPKGTQPPSKRGQLLLNFITRHDLCVTNLMGSATGPIHTHVGPSSFSTLDYILVPNTMSG